MCNTYKLINESKLELLCIKPNNSQACSWTNFFSWAQLVYQTGLKLRLKLGLFIDNKHEQAFYQAKPKLFMISLVHLQPYKAHILSQSWVFEPSIGESLTIVDELRYGMHQGPHNLRSTEFWTSWTREKVS